MLQKSLGCIAREGCGGQLCGAGRGMLVGKGGAACPASQGLGCQWAAAQISPLLLPGPRQEGGATAVRVQGRHSGQLLSWGDLSGSRENIPQTGPALRGGNRGRAALPSEAAKPECPGWSQQSPGHARVQGLACLSAGMQEFSPTLTWGLSIRPRCSRGKGQPSPPSRTAGVEAPMIPRVCPAQQSLEGERGEARLQDCQSRLGGAAGGTPGRDSALPQPAHLPRDGAAGRRGAAVLAEAGGGAAGGEHLGGGGRLAACPLPP